MINYFFAMDDVGFKKKQYHQKPRNPIRINMHSDSNEYIKAAQMADCRLVRVETMILRMLDQYDVDYNFLFFNTAVKSGIEW